VTCGDTGFDRRVDGACEPHHHAVRPRPRQPRPPRQLRRGRLHRRRSLPPNQPIQLPAAHQSPAFALAGLGLRSRHESWQDLVEKGGCTRLIDDWTVTVPGQMVLALVLAHCCLLRCSTVRTPTRLGTWLPEPRPDLVGSVRASLLGDCSPVVRHSPDTTDPFRGGTRSGGQRAAAAGRVPGGARSGTREPGRIPLVSDPPRDSE
jgi:hypothetical protein